MPPKQSNLHHITFHFYRSAVLLSLPSTTTISSLKSTLIPALQPLASASPIPLPTSPSDIKLFETPTLGEGQEPADIEGAELVAIDDAGAKGGRSIAQLEWGRWKTVFVSFRGDNGDFAQPVYTIPNAEDDEIVGDGEEA